MNTSLCRKLFFYVVPLAAATLWVAHTRSVIADSRVEADFNGDGHADLAIGLPFEDVGGIVNAGAVNIIYGSEVGLAPAGNQFWTQDSDGIEGVAESEDQFGRALAAGDFNGDGWHDLAIGVALESVGTLEFAGAVNILYGSAAGLTAAGDQIWTQNSEGILGVAESDDHFGDALSAGDFNGDGRDDLAIGATGDSVGSVNGAGAVSIVYGSAAGLTATGNQIWTQDSPGIDDQADAFDRFGFALTAGDFDGDGRDDLAVGVPDEDFGGFGGPVSAGAVHVLRGSAAGLTAEGNQFWTQDSPGIQGVLEGGDHFGSSLAAGDFNFDGQDDLAVGSPLEDIGSILHAGAVNVLYGTLFSGLTAVDNQIWSQESPGINGVAEQTDNFGRVVAGDFDGNGVDDLAIGVPRETVGNVEAGAVNVLYGVSGAGLTSLNNQIWSQDSPGIDGIAESGDFVLCGIPLAVKKRLYHAIFLRMKHFR